MSFLYQAVCNRCTDVSEVIWPLWACYSLPSEHTLEIAQRMCWCHDCKSVTLAENIADLAHIERLQALPIIANAYDSSPKVWAEAEKEAVLEYLRYPRLNHLYDGISGRKKWNVKQSIVMKNSLALHHEWRVTRSTPARCLSCGGTDFDPFIADPQGEPSFGIHPRCGGTLSLIQVRKVREKRYLWTSEGESIGIG